MKSKSVEVVDSLSLLSLKVASNVFDLSSRLHHISIRDQIVRAELAVRDLKKGDKSLQSLLIVGAGPAGIAAALEAVDQGVPNVVVVEAAESPFCLLKGVSDRYVGPYMYEWPSSFSRDQSFPACAESPWAARAKSQLEWETKSPIAADSLASKLERHLLARISAIEKNGGSPPVIYTLVDKQRVKDFILRFSRNESLRALNRIQPRKHRKPWDHLEFDCRKEVRYLHGPLPKSIAFRPQYVLLAAGMGSENLTLVAKDMDGNEYNGKNYVGCKFWGNDSLTRPGIRSKRVCVFGGGDGALQDFLRVVTQTKHPLELLERLEKKEAVRAALGSLSPMLLDAERQSRQFGAWTHGGGEYATIDAVCRRLARQLARKKSVARAISQCVAIGKGRVSLFVRGDHFDKAYLLNRFLVHLFWACKITCRDIWRGRMDFEVRFNASAVGYSVTKSGQSLVKVRKGPRGSAESYQCVCDVISVRYGIEAGTVPGAQMIQISGRASKQRTTLAKVELPFVVER